MTSLKYVHKKVSAATGAWLPPENMSHSGEYDVTLPNTGKYGIVRLFTKLFTVFYRYAVCEYAGVFFGVAMSNCRAVNNILELQTVLFGVAIHISEGQDIFSGGNASVGAAIHILEQQYIFRRDQHYNNLPE